MSDAAARPGARLMRPGLVALAAFAVDQASKWWILEGLRLMERGAVDVVPPFLRFTMAWNTGANFGLGAALGRDVWIALALAISVGLAVWALRMASPLRRACVGLVIGGALGNALDRVIHGAVVDFLNMSCCGFTNPYAFNLADVFIFAGAFGLILFDGSDNHRG